jgi:hypothetical protein
MKTSPRRKTYRTQKLQGEFAEMLFWVKAASLGFILSKPWGDSRRYDFVVDSGKRLLRIQVKSCSVLRGNFYQVVAASSCPYTPQRERRYTAGQIDFIVAYVVPHDAWYVIPIRAVRGSTAIALAPHVHLSRAKYERFREAWHLMK